MSQIKFSNVRDSRLRGNDGNGLKQISNLQNSNNTLNNLIKMKTKMNHQNRCKCQHSRQQNHNVKHMAKSIYSSLPEPIFDPLILLT